MPNENPVLPSNPSLGLDFTLSAPFEQVIKGVAASLERIITTNRETMSQSSRDRADNLWLTMLENWHDGAVDLANRIPGVRYRRVVPLDQPAPQ